MAEKKNLLNKNMPQYQRVKQGVDKLTQNIFLSTGETMECEILIPADDDVLLELIFYFPDDEEKGRLQAKISEDRRIALTAVYVNNQVDKALTYLRKISKAIVMNDLLDLGEAARPIN